MILTWFKKHKNHAIHTTNTVCYKLKTCIVQTINSAYKGIFVFYTDKVSVYTVDMKRIINWISETQTQLGGCDYWYWSGTGQLGHMHIIPPCGIKKDVFQKSLFTKKKVSCSSMANAWPRFFLLLWQGVVRGWGHVPLSRSGACCMRPRLPAAPFLET